MEGMGGDVNESHLGINPLTHLNSVNTRPGGNDYLKITFKINKQ